MHIRIEAIETAGPDRRARRLRFSGDVASRLTAASVVKALSLAEGDVIDDGDLHHSLDATELECARERALRVLGYRDRSQHELERRLLDDGYPERIVRLIIDRLTELGLLDEVRFAESWARARAASGVGPRRIAFELREKGVDPARTEAAIETAFAETRSVDRARALIRRRVPADRSERDRLVKRLVRRGYPLATALEALRQESEEEHQLHDDPSSEGDENGL